MDGPLHETPGKQDADSDYWQALINEGEAAEFINQSKRTIQGYRYRGGGPLYICLSRRCVKYRRIDLRRWVEARLRRSTSEAEAGAA